MGLIRKYQDPNTGASFGQALYVIGEVAIDTAGDRARITVATYIGVPQYSAGKAPIDTFERVVSGSAYFLNFEGPLKQMAQDYAAGLPEFSGSTVV